MPRDDDREVVHRAEGTFGSALGTSAGCVVGIAVGLGLLLLGGCVVFALLFGGCALVADKAAENAKKVEEERRAREAVTGPTPTTTRTEPTRPAPDPLHTLRLPANTSQVFLAVNEATLKEADAANITEASRMLSSGKLLAINAPTDVVIVKRGGEFTTIRLAEGEQKGKVYVVRTKDVEFVAK